MTVYADILLFVNFSMDFLTLYLAGRLLHKPMRKSRLIFAAITGSTGGTVWSLVPMDFAAVFTVAVGLLLSILMTRIAFGKNTAVGIVRDSLAVWGAGILLGGVMTCVLSLGEPVYIAENRHTKAFFPAFVICFAAASVLIRLFTTAKSRKSARVTVESAGVSRSFSVLCDSGNFAADPISGRPVILVRSGVLTEFEEMLTSDKCILHLRMIPVEGIGGTSILRGFVPDSVSVDDAPKDAVVAVCKDGKSFAGYDGILPAALCR